MPLVFVHGVRTRSGRDWERQGASRRSLFQRVGLKGLVDDPGAVSYAEPLWGDLGARPRWNNASLPAGDYETFAAGDEDPSAAAAVLDAGFEPVPDARPRARLLDTVRTTAAEARAPEDRRPLEALVDVLWGVAAERATGEKLDELAAFCQRAVQYARANEVPGWLADVENDTQLVNAFVKKVGEAKLPADAPANRVETFGVGEIRDRFVEAVGRAGNVAERLVGRGFTALVRRPAHTRTAMFLGDVLVYLDTRGDRDEPGPIVQVVAGALEQARAAVDPERDPRLIVVAHSMGGNIVYDLLTHFRPDLRVDVLVTVGSQVGFFEELKQFRASDEDVPKHDPSTERVERPQNVSCWLNIFDLNDLLGFAARGVFRDVEDYKYSTGKGALQAHGTYLTLPSFHQRFSERLRESA
jgi:hypothetical protein